MIDGLGIRVVESDGRDVDVVGDGPHTRPVTGEPAGWQTHPSRFIEAA